MPAIKAAVGVAFGGPSPEHDVSILTGLQAIRTLHDSRGGESLRALYWSKSGAWFEVDKTLEAAAFFGGVTEGARVPAGARPLELRVGPNGGFFEERGRIVKQAQQLDIEVVLVCCHGGPGEDGALQGALDLAGIAYTGPTAQSAALGMDKLATGGVLVAAGLPVLPRVLLGGDTPEPTFPGPYIVKPRFGGSSIGIDVVADFSTARARLDANVHLRRGAVLEPYRPDLFDLLVAVRTWPSVELSMIERPLRQREGAEILDYADKYVGGQGMLTAPRELPAVLSGEVEASLRDLALRAAAELGCRGVNRIDFLSDGDALYLNEVNTVPGSLSRHLFSDASGTFSDLLEALVEEAIERPAAHFSSAGADGSVLRAAGSIAAKLG